MSITTGSVAQFARAVAGARTVDLAAYTLPRGAVRTALATAAHAGAAVRVRLEGRPFGDPGGGLRAANAAAAADLRAAGADAALVASGDLAHLKAAVVDRVAWLDDRNWGAAGSTVLRDDDPGDVRAVAAALDGKPVSGGNVAMTKGEALDLELAAIRDAGAGPLAVESESFGPGAVAGALLARARAGRPTRLLVAGREAARPGGRAERTLLRHLAAAGVSVRIGVRGRGDVAEKLAVGAAEGWVGSANATFSGGRFGDQPDWGLRSRAPVLIDGLRGAFEHGWASARPLPAAT